jgi:hypothetical protein
VRRIPSYKIVTKTTRIVHDGREMPVDRLVRWIVVVLEFAVQHVEETVAIVVRQTKNVVEMRTKGVVVAVESNASIDVGDSRAEKILIEL